jgi:hypothetical protein
MNTVRIKFYKYYHSTVKAHLVSIDGKEFWLPKKLCRDFTTNKKLGGHVVITEWLYKEKFGCEPSEDMFETIVEHHTPDKLKPINNNIIKELEK